MKKLLFPILALIFGAVFMISCNQEEDVNPQSQLKDGQVSLSFVNLLSNSTPINARTSNYNPADPGCSPEPEVVVSGIPAEQRRITFIGRLNDADGNLIGYKFRARNATNTAINNVRVSVGGGTPIWSTPTLDAFTEVFFITPNPIAGVRMFWDGGDVGTASTNNNESQTRVVCESDPCEFVNFTHSAPSVFDVYFVPTDGGATIIERNVNSNNPLVVTIPLEKYTVWVTNHDDGTATPYNNLPDFSDEILMVGSNEIDYSSVDRGSVTVSNPYAAIMVANNYQLKEAPMLDGETMMLAAGDQYYVIYRKAAQDLTLNIIDIRDMNQDQKIAQVVANQQYRYLLCLKSTLDIEVESVFTDLPNDTTIDGQ